MRMHLRAQLKIILVLGSLVSLTGCLFRSSRTVPTRTLTSSPLKEATLDDLVASINASARRLQTLSASVDIDVSTGGARKGKVTDYREVSGYVLVRKPDMMRMIGLVPVVRNRLFDMVSDGKKFEVSIPPFGKFYIGSREQSGPPSPRPLENLRPQQILDALLLRPVDPEKDIAVLENGTETVKDPRTHKEAYAPNYAVVIVHKDAQGWYLSRKVVFSRIDLLPHEQYLYNREGTLVTFTRYEDFIDYGNTRFPSHIDIQRPIEEYSISLTVTKLKLNEPLKDEQFVLTQPPGSKLINLDQRDASASIRPDMPGEESRR